MLFLSVLLFFSINIMCFSALVMDLAVLDQVQPLLNGVVGSLYKFSVQSLNFFYILSNVVLFIDLKLK